MEFWGGRIRTHDRFYLIAVWLTLIVGFNALLILLSQPARTHVSESAIREGPWSDCRPFHGMGDGVHDEWTRHDPQRDHVTNGTFMGVFRSGRKSGSERAWVICRGRCTGHDSKRFSFMNEA